MAILLLSLFVVLLHITHLYAATYNNYQYDMTVPQFTPDGRLLQIEYASSAADRSFPIVVAPLGSDFTVLLTVRPSHKVVQERLIVLKESDTVVALSGILADSLALMQKVQEETLNNRRLYGEALTSLQVATTISSACQQHAFGGGLRPYGSTIVVCGIEAGKIKTRVADPSGALQEVDGVEPTVVGGGALQGLKETMQRELRSLWGSIQDSDLSKGIAQIARVAIEEQKGRDADKKGSQGDDPIVEVVVVSSSNGVYKLTEKQVQALLKRA